MDVTQDCNSSKWRNPVGRDSSTPALDVKIQGQRIAHSADNAAAANGVAEAGSPGRGHERPSAAPAGVGPSSPQQWRGGGHKAGPTESERNLAALTEQLRLGMNLASGPAASGRPENGQGDRERSLPGGGERSQAVSEDDAVVAAADSHRAVNGHVAEQQHHARPRAEQAGECPVCHKVIRNKVEACTAMGRSYHVRCFTCFACGRTLKGKPFYWLQDKAYCEEDYKYTGFQQMAEHCRACGQLILDVVLQAVGQPYHPGCFRCQACNTCLDGQPFTLDSAGSPLCITDYHRLYAPICASCKGAILPLQGTDETVRVTALGKDYHIDCYHCMDCGVQLTDEPEQRCYPLGDMLLCRPCHIVRLRGADYRTESERSSDGARDSQSPLHGVIGSHV